MAGASVGTVDLRKAGASHWWSCMGTGCVCTVEPTTSPGDSCVTIRLVNPRGWKSINLEIPGKNYPTTVGKSVICRHIISMCPN